MKRTTLAAAVLLAGTALFAMPAQAQVTLGGEVWTSTGTTLQLNTVVPDGNQPLNVVCIICGDNQPQQPLDFGYTNFKNSGNETDLIYFSTNVSRGGDPGFDTVGRPTVASSCGRTCSPVATPCCSSRLASTLTTLVMRRH